MLSLYFSGRRRARRFTEFVYASYDRRKDFPATKGAGRAAANAMGIRPPRLYREFDSPASIDLSGLPNRFVIRADAMSARRGVYVLVREGEEYFDRFTQQSYSEEGLRADLLGRLNKNGREPSPRVFAEEFIEGENGAGDIPFDYKFFVFGGGVELIELVDRNQTPTAIAFFDGDFAPLESACFKLGKSAQQAIHRRPANWREMTEAAERAAKYLAVPFVRVDLYTTGTEIILGEFTKRPGGAYQGRAYVLSDVFDGELGAYFRVACRNMGLEIPMIEGLPPVLERAQKQWEREHRMFGIPFRAKTFAKLIVRTLKGTSSRSPRAN
jgi:hypothetical protein